MGGKDIANSGTKIKKINYSGNIYNVHIEKKILINICLLFEEYLSAYTQEINHFPCHAVF